MFRKIINTTLKTCTIVNLTNVVIDDDTISLITPFSYQESDMDVDVNKRTIILSYIMFAISGVDSCCY